jgi:PAS domain-containing protein
MDVTAAKQAEEKLQRSEAYLAEGQNISHTGSFGWSVLSGEIYWSEETYFEQDRAVKPTLQLIFQQIHPDDRDRAKQTLDHAINEKTDFDIEHRLLMPDGSVKHLHAIARVEDLAGQPRICGCSDGRHHDKVATIKAAGESR